MTDITNRSFADQLPNNTHVTARRILGQDRIDVFITEGRRRKERYYGSITGDLNDQQDPGLQQLTQFLKAAKYVSTRKGGTSPFLYRWDVATAQDNDQFGMDSILIFFTKVTETLFLALDIVRLTLSTETLGNNFYLFLFHF